MEEEGWQLQEIVDDLGMEEARLISTTVVLLLTIGLYLVAPLVVVRLTRLRQYPVIEARYGDGLDYIERTVKWPFPTRAVVRTLQFLIIFGSVLVLLVVWGFVDQAITLADVFVDSLPFVIRLLFTVLLLAAGFIGTRMLEVWLRSYSAEADHVTEHQEGVAFRVLQIVTFGAIILLLLSVWDLDPTGLLVGAGFAGIVLGLAAQQTLGSLIAGLVLMFSRPFTIGDWVGIGDHEGIVTDISITNTRLRTFNDESVVIPNDTVANRTVVNYTESTRLRLSLDVGVEYTTDVEHASDVALEAIEDIDLILRNPQPSVVPTSFDDSSIGLRLRYWIEHPSKPKEWKVHAAVLAAVKEAFEAHDITIPFPQRELSGSVNGSTRPTGGD